MIAEIVLTPDRFALLWLVARNLKLDHTVNYLPDHHQTRMRLSNGDWHMMFVTEGKLEEPQWKLVQ